MNFLNEWAAVWSFVAHDLIVIVVLPIVLLRRKEPAGTVAWIFAVLLMPFVGAVAFLIFGNNRLTHRAQRVSERKLRLRGQLGKVISNVQSPIDAKGQLQMYRLLERISPLPATTGNLVEIFSDMRYNFDRQLEAIRGARHHVHIEYYIVSPIGVGREFQRELIAAAKRGVEVRFLYDAAGSLALGRSFLKEMRDAGVETASFIPFNLFTRRWIFNFRNHRKIVVVDGVVGFTGGANVGDEYMFGMPQIGTWRDTHLRLEGPAVLQLQRTFAEDWSFATGQDLAEPEHFPPMPAAGDVIAQVVPGGPDLDVDVYHELFFSAVANAVERVRIATPYFVPSEAMLVALQTAARRGVYVQVIVPQRSTHNFVQFASQSFYEELLEAGVAIFEYQPGFLHSKLMTVDGRWSIIGSANCDNRSMKLNFELGVVFFDFDTTLQVERIMDADINYSRRVFLEEWITRSPIQRIIENFARLFTPIL